jgi:hypothetical protein
MMWVAMNIGPICFVLLVCFVVWRAVRPRPRPKPKPPMTPWHPELGRKQANARLVFYLFLYGPGWMLVMWATHGHFR